MDKNEIIFFLAATPGVLSVLYGVYISARLFHCLDKNKEMAAKYSGYGGEEYWKDAKKIDDPNIQKLIFIHENKLAKYFVIGTLATCALEGLFFYWVQSR